MESMKPGIRKRQQAFELYLDLLSCINKRTKRPYTDGELDEEYQSLPVTEFDEAYIVKNLTDGLHVNKLISCYDYHRLWYGIIEYLCEVDTPAEELIKWIDRLTEHGADIFKDKYIIEKAATDGWLTLFKVLVEHYQVSIADDDFDYLSKLLWWDKEAVNAEFLIDYCFSQGVDKNEPLLFAASERNIPLVQMLINKGADVNYQDSKGVSALMWACGQPIANADWAPQTEGQYELTKLLLEHGADPTLRSNQKRTAKSILMKPFSHTAGKNEEEIATLLEKYEVKFAVESD